MSFECKRSEGEVYYNNDNIIHFTSFGHVSGDNKYQSDERTRFAYLVVSRNDALEIAGSLKNFIELEKSEKILGALKSHHTQTLLDAIALEESDINAPQYVQHSYPIGDENRKDVGKKRVYLINAPAYHTSAQEDVLHIKKFFSAKTICKDKFNKEDKNKEEKRKNISYLHVDIKDCHLILGEENAKKTSLAPNDRRAYALISVPYLYNYGEREHLGKKYRTYKLKTYEKSVSISLMPKQKIEYGVFFDGTNNNMYNIDFFQNYKKYMSEVGEYQGSIYAKKRHENDDIEYENKIYTTFQDYIVHHPRPDKEPYIMQILRNEIVGDVRYFEHKSTELDIDYDENNTDKASKDSKKVFDYFLNIRKTYEKEKAGKVKPKEYKNDKGKPIDKESYDKQERRRFLMEEILPTDDPISSYVNGYTNIKRMYDVYKGTDSKSREKVAHIENLNRFKVYGSGSGTKDPFDRKYLDDDDIPGLAFGMSTSGVVAHAIYTCEKIVDEFRKHHITYADELVLDIFGFSRGATEARHFACSIMNNYSRLHNGEYLPYALNTDVENKTIFDSFYNGTDNAYTIIAGKYHFNPLRSDVYGVNETGGLLFSKKDIQKYSPAKQVLIETNPRYIEDNKGEPIIIRSVSFRHINIGDTVTHHGLYQSDDSEELKLAFDENKLGSLYHIMAMDEYRFNFDAHSIFAYKEDSKIELLKQNCIKYKDGHFKELIVPGAHADVGGGYKESGEDELIKLPTCTDRDIRRWNKKFGWVGKQIEPQEVDSIDDIKEEGFYFIAHNWKGTLVDLHKWVVPKDYYMYRKDLSWEYELVTLKLMQDEALSKYKEEYNRVPMERFTLPIPEGKNRAIPSAWRDTNISAEKKDILDRTYDALAKRSELSVDEHQKLRQHFVHHSSKPFRSFTKKEMKDWFANQPSWQPEEIIFGKRVVYDTAGVELKKWADSWFKNKPANFNQGI